MRVTNFTIHLILFLLSLALCTSVSAKIIYVDDDSAGANNGTSWENAYVYLQDALADANESEKPIEIRVAKGTYKPDQGVNQTAGDRDATFRLVNDVTLKGGYAGIGHADPNVRNIAPPVIWDLAGQWFLGGSDIQGNHTWDGLVTINSSGIVTGGMLSSSEGSEYSLTGGDLSIDMGGRITGTLKDSDGVTTELTLQMNHSNSIMAGEGNAEIDNEDGVFIFIKKSSGFKAEILSGEWFLGGSDIQDNHTWDGHVVIDNGGTVKGGTLSSSEGPEYRFTGGEFSLDPTGRITGTISDSDGITTQLTMQMDVSGSIMAGEGNSLESQEDGVFILIKKASDFTVENLAGEWFLGGSDIQGDHTWDGLVIINDIGAVIGGTLTSSEGPVYELTGGELAIDDNGKVTGMIEDSDGVTTDFTMQMSKSKSLMAGEANARSDNEDGVFVFVRRLSGYETILSGDLNDDDIEVADPCDLIDEPTRVENSYHVVYSIDVDANAVLDGLIVTGGNTAYSGAGMYNTGSPVLINCIFRRNVAANGGGIYSRIFNEFHNATLTNCTFIENSATSGGGGMYNIYNSSPTLTNCTFTGNFAFFSGGGMVNYIDSSPILTNCTFNENSVGLEGGGMYNDRRSSPTLTDCKFNSNSADFGGGMNNRDYSSPILTSCTFTDNSANVIGGGMNNYGYSSPTLTNCTFISNSASSGGGMNNNHSSPVLTGCTFTGNSANGDASGGGGLRHFSGHYPILTNCTFRKNSSEWNGGGIHTDGVSPILTGCTFTGNSANISGGGMYIFGRYSYSPTMTNCIFSGNLAGENGGGITCNSDVNPKIVNCIFTGNRADNGNALGCYTSMAEFSNCIIWNGSDAIWKYDNSIIDITYSNIFGGWEGEGNIDANPLFADTVNGDYHLKSEMGRWDPNSGSWVKDDVTSPCIDAGDPNSDFSGETWPHGGRINMGAYGGTREASMSLETGGLSLPNVAYIYSYRDEGAEDFEFLLESYGCPTTLIKPADIPAMSLDSYDLIVIGHDTQYEDTWSNPNIVAAIENSNKPIVGLGDGGYDFFGLLGLSIGNPYGGHSSKNSIKVVDPNNSLFSTPYSIEIPEDRILQLYTETESIGIYLWPAIPDTLTVFGHEADDVGYFPLVMQHNRYLLWGFTESPQKMTEVGKKLFINVVIRTANKAWGSDI